MQTLILKPNTTVEWGTPQELYDELNEEFNFTLDPCAREGMQKCEHYFTPDQDGLAQDWAGHTVFMNPPFDNVRSWVEKAILEGSKPDTCVVALLPVRAGSHWWHGLGEGQRLPDRAAAGSLPEKRH